jgi:hypothetical protein
LYTLPLVPLATYSSPRALAAIAQMYFSPGSMKVVAAPRRSSL